MEVPEQEPVRPGRVHRRGIDAPGHDQPGLERDQGPQRLVQAVGRHRGQPVQPAQQQQLGAIVGGLGQLAHRMRPGAPVGREGRAVHLHDSPVRAGSAELRPDQRLLSHPGLPDEQVVPALRHARGDLLPGPQERGQQVLVGPDPRLLAHPLRARRPAQVPGVVAAGHRRHVRALATDRLGHRRRAPTVPGSAGQQAADQLPGQVDALGRGLGAAARRQVHVLAAELPQGQAGQREIGQRAQVGAVQLTGPGVGQHPVPVGREHPLALPLAAEAETLDDRPRPRPLPVGHPVGDPLGQHPRLR